MKDTVLVAGKERKSHFENLKHVKNSLEKTKKRRNFIQYFLASCFLVTFEVYLCLEKREKGVGFDFIM